MRTARAAVAAALVLMASGMVPPAASAEAAPGSVTVTVAAGKTSSARVAIAATAAIDVALVFDTTASLGMTLEMASDAAAEIVADIQRRVPDARFAVAQFKDQGSSPEYRVEQAMTPDGALVAEAVAGLSAKGGGDLPEAYNLAFTRSAAPAVGGALGWRSGARKFVVVVGDAEPHGAGTAGIAGCEDTSMDPHGLDTAVVLSALSDAGRTLVMVHQMDHHSMLMDQMPASSECYQGLAAAAGGIAVHMEGDMDLHESIVGAVTDGVGSIPEGAAELRVAGATPAPAEPGWASVGPGSPSTGSGTSFVVSVAVPKKTRPGTYVFDLAATVGGSDFGHATLRVKVKPVCKKTEKRRWKHGKAKCVSAKGRRP
jgi:hypothetical protein